MVAEQAGDRAAKARQAAYQIPQKIYDTPIEELDLTVRAYNCLKRSSITKVGQVLTMSERICWRCAISVRRASTS